MVPIYGVDDRAEGGEAGLTRATHVSEEMASAPLTALERPRGRGTNTVFKSGPLFISSKGIGWKSWKRRWFILTRTSLVFFKNDPNALPHRGGEVNLTLGGIDLNNSGSVVVREDKKLLTVLFPDGRDGRAFTLKAESSEDLFEWKAALEHALAEAPDASLVMGHNGIFRNDVSDTFEGSFQEWKDKHPVKSLVVGRPILLALEDIDGSPSFLEKALCFLEQFGSKVEGILRQAADVEEVERRVQEYEQGKTEFSPEEDAHVVGDCVKLVLRELPSSPVPASCCTSLLEAYRIDQKEARVAAMRAAISETFPEPNRRLLQRVLKMMRSVAHNTAENRMTASAVAACMAPLLLRPLLAGECELEDDLDMSGDCSAQFLAAANAANNAQGIIRTLLEEYENVFDEEQLNVFPSVNYQMEDSGSDDSVNDEHVKVHDDVYHDLHHEDDDGAQHSERMDSGKLSGSSGNDASDLYDYKVFEGADSDVEFLKETHASEVNKLSTREFGGDNKLQGPQSKSKEFFQTDKESPLVVPKAEPYVSTGDVSSSVSRRIVPCPGHESCTEKLINKTNGTLSSTKRSNFWGRSGARKNLSMESIDSPGDEELVIRRLESTKNELRNRIAKEAKGNAILQASLERRKLALHERRLALEQDVSRLQEQLQAERDLRAALEAGLSMSSGQLSSRSMDSKTRAELEEIALAEADVARLKQKVAELHLQLDQQRQHHFGSLSDAYDQYQLLQKFQSQPKIFQQDFDSTLAFCNYERAQRSEDPSSAWRSIKPQVAQSALNRQVQWKPPADLSSPAISKVSEASTSLSTDEICAIDSSVNKASGDLEGNEQPRQPLASSTLVELTTRLDFFKERRSQLMEQLHNLDLSYRPNSQGPVYKASPPWTSPR
ncbi:Rho GTPase-activating protein 7 [Nymphaea thermarum]|nr:Rho GTPase-activating protein 7 [Nymphaea thermarum]